MATPKTAPTKAPRAWPISPRPSVEEILRAVQITSLTRELDLSYARGLTPRSLKALLMCLPNLRKLVMRHTDVGRLPDAFRFVPELRELDVSSNGLTELPPSLGELTKLQHLTATGNRLESLPQSIGRLHNLRFLNVSSNRIVALGPEIRFCKSLRVLRLASNRLGELTGNVGELPQLQLLQLAFNRLRRLPPELAHASQLRVLNVAFNALDKLPDNFASMIELAHLDLTGNDITAMPACLTHLETLRVRGLEHSNWRVSDQKTQVTTSPLQRRGQLWSDEATSRTREIDLSPAHAARAVIGGLKRALDGLTHITQASIKLAPQDKTVLHGSHYKGQINTQSAAQDDSALPARVSTDRGHSRAPQATGFKARLPR